MRSRLVVTLVALTAVILVVFGVVRGFSTADLVRDQQRDGLRESTSLASVAIAAQERGPDGVTADFLATLAGRDRVVTYVDPAGSSTVGGTDDVGPDDLSASAAVDGGGRVTLTESGSVQSERVRDALLPLVLLTVALAIVAALVGTLLARRFARPFRRLADDAARIGDGHFDTEVHRSRIKEADDLGTALRRAAGQLGTLVERERELSVVASHELRTPLTALRLSLEDLTLWPQTPPDVAEELQHSLAEVDRLSGVVTSLLERGDGSHLGTVTQTDLAALAEQTAARWADRARAAGRTVHAGPSDDISLPIVRASVDQILDALVERALADGTGDVTIDAVRLSTHARLRVLDESHRTLATGIVQAAPAGQTGTGLVAAATQAESLGGFVGVEDAATTGLVLALPWPRRRIDA
ncbi:HAMP domain-containing sensor histidine kinase [Aeromicrobium sp. Root472D3]|uniref:histidine kinase dimerization/phospho-acceptor domain-containing protein n=1 Tax=Aeromicrobium sp. Root472D3 TaxID=1736540 RepID=UPI0009EC22F2|nr:HAMP domain-containing sensor histidine kinase [Aeromicrobium sp. Root472D3]